MNTVGAGDSGSDSRSPPSVGSNGGKDDTQRMHPVPATVIIFKTLLPRLWGGGCHVTSPLAFYSDNEGFSPIGRLM